MEQAVTFDEILDDIDAIMDKLREEEPELFEPDIIDLPMSKEGTEKG